MAAQAASVAQAQDALGALMRSQAELARQMFGPLATPALDVVADPEQAIHWVGIAQRLQALWLEYQAERAGKASTAQQGTTDFTQIAGIVEGWLKQMPLTDSARQMKLLEGGFQVWQAVLGQFRIDPEKGIAPDPGADAALPRSDPRFTDPQWREQPFFALLHQGYLLLSDELTAMAESVEGLDPVKKDQLRFTTRAIVDALSPANFPMTNPLAIERARQTRGESLVKGLEHLLADLRRGQMTHSQSTAFKLGENIATTPGKVVYEAPLYQIIQYTPVTEQVMKLPVVVFPAWINRFYILDLNPRKSFVRWAVEQGLSVFMVSWKSADETLRDIVWDDYIAAQIDVVNFVRERLTVPAVHTIGYCVAGTTLAATLAVLARKGEANLIASATFFTAQVDFDDAGELKNFANSQTIETIAQMAPSGYLDGRYLAAAFNLLRGNDLIWSYVAKNYLLGEDYQSFDLLHWNGDVTNLPAAWHGNYMRDLYRDNRLVVPDALSATGTPLDLRRIETPCYIQAGRDDHIAPAESVYKLTHHLQGPWMFQLAGSGHIAGVINPPSANKYQFWTNDGPANSLAEFVAGATEHAGSWWPHWLEWLRSLDPDGVPVQGRRIPGAPGDRVLEDAPGSYVRTR